MGNICYAEQNDENDAPRDLPQQIDIPVSTLNLRTCFNCEFFKSIDFKYALQLMNIKGFDEKIQLLTNISIPKLHKYFKVQGQLRFLPECRDMEFDEIREFNYVLGQELSKHEPEDILVTSIPLNMTTSWFQRFLSSKKKITNYDLQTRKQFLYYNSRIQDVELSVVEQLLVFYLRWGVSFEKFKFITYNLIKDDYLRFIYDHLKYMYHLTLTLNILINEYPIEEEFLLIYAIIYEKYRRIMWQFQQEYDFCGDGLMQMYYKYFQSGDQEPTSPEDIMPHFKLISIYQRYWCKRVMNSQCKLNPKKKIVILIESLNQTIILLRQKEVNDRSDFQIRLLRIIFSQILDCSVNEISIHWVGHSKLNFADEYLGQFIMELKKQSKDYYQQRYNNLNLYDFSKFVDEDLNLMKSIFPEWFISHFIESIGILKKADKLKDYLQLLLNDQILSIKSSEEINNDLILAVKKEAETQYLNQQKFMKQKDKIQQLQEQPEPVVLQQSDGFIKFILHKISLIKVRSKVEKTALFLDSISRIQRNNYDVAQICTIQQIQKHIADQTTRASDARYIAEGDIKFYLTDTLINELFEPSQESLDIARELERNNQNLITNIYELDRQQKLNNYLNLIRDEQIQNYVVSLNVSKERSLDKLSFTKNYDFDNFDNFNNIKLQKWKNIKRQYEYQYYDGIITKLEEAIRNQDQTIKNKERKLKDAQNKLKDLNS